MYQIKRTPPPTHDFMGERSLKLTKIFNVNPLKYDCQNQAQSRTIQAQSRIIKTESITVSTRAEI